MTGIARRLMGISKVKSYDISNPVFVTSFSYSAQTVNNFGIHISANGEHLYICSALPINTYQYTMSTPWDISSASYVRANSLNGGITIPVGVKLSVDGTKLISYGEAVSDQYDMLRQYNLSTAWNISTATLTSEKQNLGSLDNIPRDLVVSDDGLTIVTVGNSSKTIRKFSLSTAFDVSTATQVQTYNDTWMSANARSLAASRDGLKLFYLDATDITQELVMTSPWDLSTITLGNTFDTNPDEITPLGLDFGDGGKKLYIAGRGNYAIREYNLI